MRRAVAAAVALVLFAACSADPYPLNPGPPRVAQRSPVAVGAPVQAVVLFIEVRPGDTIELLGAEPIGVDEAAAVRLFLSRPVDESDGSHTIGVALENLPGATVSAVDPSPGPRNAVGIVAEMTASRAGRFTMTSIRLRYRLNGGPEQVREGTDVVWTVCADDPAPTDCPEGEE